MSTLEETEHARQRRAERAIDKQDLKNALKHGQELPCQYGRKFNYKGLTYIVDRRKKKEITCYAQKLKLKKVKISPELKQKALIAQQRLKREPSSWKSNSVIVIDTSGSMRESDVWGAPSRLDSIWICVALDFIAHRIECGNTGLYDVVSVVLMGEKGHTIIKMKPTSWEIYNDLIEIYSRRLVPAKGHGYYVPSLKIAEKLLNLNKSNSCALAFLFLSDGRPSDAGDGGKGLILSRMEALGTRFGRRLTFKAIGIGNDDTGEFEMLKAMVDTTKDFGAQAVFELPSMTTSSLGDSLTSTSTTLTKTQVEMTDVKTLKQVNVREILRESRKKANEEVVSTVCSDDYYLYSKQEVTRRIYREWHNDDRKRMHAFEVTSMQNQDAEYVAINKKAFGEGAERFAFRFFEVGQDGQTVVGSPLVAKESRLVLEGGEVGREKFVRVFCEAQQLARRIANEFNAKLDWLRRVDDRTPRVTFLDCSVYELDDVKMGKQSVLVEEKIDHLAWHKWNMNNGYVEGMNEVPDFTHDKMRAALEHLANFEVDGVDNGLEDPWKTIGLDVINEGEEDEESDEGLAAPKTHCDIRPVTFSPSEVAQAFSHFSYVASGRKRLICDLQGVYDKEDNLLKFTDPVILYYNHRKQNRENVHGRTDRGRKGMAMFFHTHRDCCGHLCRLVTGGFKNGHRRRHET